MKYFLSFILLFVFSSCASVHPGVSAQTTTASKTLPINVSAQSVDFNADDAFQLFEVTVENTSGSWVKIHNTEVVIDDPVTSGVSVVLGSDLRDWAQTAESRSKMTKFNKSLAQVGMVTVGAVTAIGGDISKNSKLKDIGVITALSGTAWVISDIIRGILQYPDRVSQNPENHLYQPFGIPGKLFMRRWVLLNKPVGYEIKKLKLKFETVEGDREEYDITL